MEIGEPLRELGPVAIDSLRAAILTQEDAAWREQQQRQDEYEVHRHAHRIA